MFSLAMLMDDMRMVRPARLCLGGLLQHLQACLQGQLVALPAALPLNPYLPCMVLQVDQQLGPEWDALVDACSLPEPSQRPTYEALIASLAALC
jgi:hypothetical protein